MVKPKLKPEFCLLQYLCSTMLFLSAKKMFIINKNIESYLSNALIDVTSINISYLG